MPGSVRDTGGNTESEMTDEQIEQVVRKVVGQDANPRKVQALMWAVERYGIEWLDTYQQRQRGQSTAIRQRTSRQRVTLDWTDVEAWVMRQLQTSENWAVGGYYTTCPVPTHKTDDLISVWSGNDGGLGLKCWGNCTYNDIHKALADAIKTGAPSVTEPPAAADARIKELEDHIRELREALDDTNDKDNSQEELKTLRGELDTKVKEVEAIQKELTAVKNRRDRFKRERDSASRKLSRREKKISNLQNDVQKLQEEKLSLEKHPAAASKAPQEAANNDLERAALEDRVRNLRTANSNLENRLTAARAESDDLLEAAEEERDRERMDRIAAETERDRERDTRIAAETERDRERTVRTAAENRAREFRGNGRLSSAWSLLSKDEPTYAFIDAVCILENDLHQLVGHGQWPRPQLERMLTAACELHFIDETKQEKLQEMRRKRNRILHQNQRLGGPQAHNDLAYLERVIGQLGT